MDVNECTLDWITSNEQRDEYLQLLAKVIVSELPELLGCSFSDIVQTESMFILVHEQMVSNVRKNGRLHPNEALEWWKWADTSSTSDLRQRKLYLAPLFIEAARAYLSIQASSASAERLFGDAGYYEGARR